MLVASMTRQVQDILSQQNGEEKWESSDNVRIQEKAFMQWCNLFLKSKGFEIDNILELEDGVCLIILLEIVSGKNLYEVETNDDSDVSRNWQIILKHLKQENIQLPEFQDLIVDEAKKVQLLLHIIWRIILRYQIYDITTNTMKLKELDFRRASQSLLKWVQSKMTNYQVSNFTSDWTDGIALCSLVNAIRPDTIPESMFLHTNNPEMNVRLACRTAEDELAIPELIAHYDIANGKADERSIMTYVALFRSADRMIKRGIKTKTYSSDVSMTSESESEGNFEPKRKGHTAINEIGIPYQPARCVAFGAGLRWGQVGKPAEFIVRLNGAEASDLSVSIECRPYDHRAAMYKPELQIKPIGESSYIVRYTPTRPGEYVLSIFCGGEHISGSPFRLSVQETVLLAKQYHDEELIINLNPRMEPLTANNLTKSLESSGSLESHADSAFVDDEALSTGSNSSPPAWLDQESHELFTKLAKFIRPDSPVITAYGKGLHVGEVGVVGSFNVCTPNTDKGPLSVSITCPAMSIPVPCVKTKLQPGSLIHDVLYIPTEPGVYEIDIKWADKDIPGNPFRLVVGESVEDINEKELRTSSLNKVKRYETMTSNKIFIYYSATSTDPTEHDKKNKLEKMLRHIDDEDNLFLVPIDLELSTLERCKLYRKANTKRLPFVFAADRFLGTLNDIQRLNHKGGLKRYLYDKVESVKSTIMRLSSSSDDIY